jgi:hypothetical protein
MESHSFDLIFRSNSLRATESPGVCSLLEDKACLSGKLAQFGGDALPVGGGTEDLQRKFRASRKL